MADTIKSMIKKPKASVFRRAEIKRRSSVTGLFESTWFDVSADVKTWGKVTNTIDAARRYKFTFGNLKLVMQNSAGKYNSNDSPTSLWYNYMTEQRTLVRIKAGFLKNTRRSDGVYVRDEFPSQTLWDEAIWDADASVWDATQSSTVFKGILSGDVFRSDKNDVAFNIKPLVSIFQDFPARNLTGWTSTGLTASQFVTMVRDQTDGSGNYVFRPFFDDTTSTWDISTTSTVYSDLNTGTAVDVIDKTVWQVFEKLAEAENYVPFVSKNGTFKFVSRTAVDTTTIYEFHGAGSYDGEYGHTLKNIGSYAFKMSDFYSRVQVKWSEADTSTSYEVVETTMTVSAVNNAWALGSKTLAIENNYIPNASTAQTLAQQIYNDVSALKKNLEFTTSFIPHLDLFDRFSVSYDPTEPTPGTLWDQNNWADTVSGSEDLLWDPAAGDTILLTGQEFKFLTFELDLDNFQNKFIAREV